MAWLLVLLSSMQSAWSVMPEYMQVWAFAEGNGYLSANTEAYACESLHPLPCMGFLAPLL